MKRLHVIFVPGLGDARPLGQDKGIGWWRRLGVVPRYHPVGWASDESFEDKLSKLLEQIDEITAAGENVALIGFSAGASMVLNAFAERKNSIPAVILISGWLPSPRATSPRLLRHNPAFGPSLERLQANLAKLSAADKAKLLTLNPLVDPATSYKNASIPGVKHWRTFAFSHAMSILVALTVYAPLIVRYIKRLAV